MTSTSCLSPSDTRAASPESSTDVPLEELRALVAARLATNGPRTHELVRAAAELWSVHLPHQLLNERELLGQVCKALRSVLVQRSRRGGFRVDGAGTTVPLDERGAIPGGPQVLALDTGLKRLARESEDLANLAEVICYSGLGRRQVAELLGLPLEELRRKWRVARALLAAYGSA